ncbi:MAG: hypothetical protein CMF80_07905, partial [Candidatus Marinimicrobia bacterium]|nr:hypothetical protein [Candidatus Neomarinimicrobiota bacterium]
MVNLKNPTMIILGGLLVMFIGILRPYLKRVVAREILGEEVFTKISDIKDKIDIVDVFRPSKEVYAIAEDTIKIGAKVLWLQLG